MIFDTDVLIWIQRGSVRASSTVEKETDRLLSVQSYMELLQCAGNKRQQDCARDFLRAFDFRILPLTENIGHRATVYIEQYSLSHGLRTGDAIIAATASENDVVLCSANAKHFKPIRDLKLKILKP